MQYRILVDLVSKMLCNCVRTLGLRYILCVKIFRFLWCWRLGSFIYHVCWTIIANHKSSCGIKICLQIHVEWVPMSFRLWLLIIQLTDVSILWLPCKRIKHVTFHFIWDSMLFKFVCKCPHDIACRLNQLFMSFPINKWKFLWLG